MELNAMAVREQQWLETIQIAKQSGLPVNQRIFRGFTKDCRDR